MAKLTYEDRIKIYQLKQSGMTFKELELKFSIDKSKIKYLVKLIDLHGFNALRKDKNRYYSKELKLKIINEVLIDNNSINSTVFGLKYFSASSSEIFA